MQQRLSLIGVLIVVVVHAKMACATELGFHLTGTVTDTFFEMPYGKVIPVGTNVNIQFVYETNSPASHSNFNCDCLGYEQNHINGFRVQFGDVRLQADSYLIQIANNLQFQGQPPFDSFSVAFDSTLVPPPQAPLFVDGVPYTRGILSFSLAADASLFAGPDLPSELDPSTFSFPSLFNPLDHNPPGIPEVLYSLSSMEEIDLLGSDHDLDGDVDGRDFLIWQQYFGTSGQNGDAISDGEVNQLDLNNWQMQYGNAPGTLQAGVIVPEPSSSIICSFLLFTFSKGRRRLVS